MNPKDIGPAIRARRLELGLSQVQVAKRVKTNQCTVSQYETTAATPSLAMLIRLCKALHLKITLTPSPHPLTPTKP